MKSEWKVKSYSRCPERKPTGWEIKGSYLSIYVTCGHIDYPGEWVMHCHKLGINAEGLKCDNLPDAKDNALSMVDEYINKLVRDVSIFTLSD